MNDMEIKFKDVSDIFPHGHYLRATRYDYLKNLDEIKLNGFCEQSIFNNFTECDIIEIIKEWLKYDKMRMIRVEAVGKILKDFNKKPELVFLHMKKKDEIND